MIQTDTDHNPQMWKNLPKNVVSDKEINNFMKVIDKYNKPIPLTYKDANIGEINFGYLHFGDSAIVHKLQTWGYVQIIAIGLFVFLGFSGLVSSEIMRKNIFGLEWLGRLPIN